MKAIVDRARRDAETLKEGGCDLLLLENMGDVPYLAGRAEPEVVAAMAVVAAEVARIGAPFGVQVLAGANLEALAVAVAAGASFVRVEAFAYAHVADEGWLEASAGELLRRRSHLGAEVEVWADIQKKHAAHAVTGDLSVRELAEGTAFCGADALVVTGMSTGKETSTEDLLQAQAAALPVVVGSGVTPENAHRFTDLAAGLIVGSSLKADGDWRQPVDLDRVRAVRRAVD